MAIRKDESGRLLGKFHRAERYLSVSAERPGVSPVTTLRRSRGHLYVRITVEIAKFVAKARKSYTFRMKETMRAGP